MRIHWLNWLRQVVLVTGFSLRTIPERKGSVAASVFGIAGVVAVFVGVLSIDQGFRQALIGSASANIAMVLRAGADTEMTSGLGREDVRVVANAPGLARGTNGPQASPELFVIINLPKRSTGTDANVAFRGVEPPAFEVHRQLHILHGRNFRRGHNELIVGRGAAAQFAGLDVGSTLEIGRNHWEIVGLFEANGGMEESEIWTDAAVLQPAYRRGTSYQSVLLTLQTPEAFDACKDFLTSDPRLNVKVVRQADYFAEQSQVMTRLILGLGISITSLMGVGAVFGALNTMYTAVSARAREMATLRALGFGGAAVMLSVLLESLALSWAGGALGGGLAYLAFDGYRTATLNFQSFSQVAFAFTVTPSLLVEGVLWASVMGFIGGLFPALRAMRLPIATALRAS
jgi:putative ABC transport system permease protein